MTMKMDRTEIIFNTGSTLLFQYYAVTNLPILANFQNNCVTEVIGSLYKFEYQLPREAYHGVVI